MSTTATEVLRRLSLFRGLSDEVLAAVAERTVFRSLTQGTILFRKDEPCLGLHVVVEGAVQVYRANRDGREQVLHTQGPGQPLAEVPLLDGGAYPAYARAIEESRVLFLPISSFQWLYRHRPELADAVIQELGRRLRRMVRLVEKISLRDVPGARRGLSAVELVAGDAHGVATPAASEEAASWKAAAAAAGVRIAAYRLGSLEEAGRAAAARLSALLGAPIVAPAGTLAPLRLEALAAAYDAAGGSLLLAHGTAPTEASDLRAALDRVQTSALGLAWEIHPQADDPAAAARMLDAAGERLRLIRLYGGPEFASQTGQGIGALLARLALARYAGPLVLTPSDTRHARAWRNWLGRTAGWGCGSKTADPSLVQLTA